MGLTESNYFLVGRLCTGVPGYNKKAEYTLGRFWCYSGLIRTERVFVTVKRLPKGQVLIVWNF